jgi:hypothetical protein
MRETLIGLAVIAAVLILILLAIPSKSVSIVERNGRCHQTTTNSIAFGALDLNSNEVVISCGSER